MSAVQILSLTHTHTLQSDLLSQSLLLHHKQQEVPYMGVRMSAAAAGSAIFGLQQHRDFPAGCCGHSPITHTHTHREDLMAAFSEAVTV